nr:hypothetical protein [Tanacetum cinerariifolium]
PLFYNDEINSDELESHVESNSVEFTSNHDTVKFDNLDEFSGPLIPIHIAKEERIRREHANYINRMEIEIILRQDQQSLTIQCGDTPSIKKFEQLNKIDFIDAGGTYFFSEEIENFLNDDSIPIGVENSEFNMEEEILFLESLLSEEPCPNPLMIPNQTKFSIKEPEHSFSMGQIMAPVTRQGPSTLPNNTNPNNVTQESVQAMIDQALLRNSTNGDGSHSSHEDNRRNVQTARTCFYADFKKCQPLNFKGAEGVGEIKKLEIKLCNLKVKENNVSAYTERFQELTLICTKFVADETEKIDKYVSGIPDNIYGSVKASKPKTLDETTELVNDLMDQKLRTYAERQVYNMGTCEKKPYSRNLPKCTKCHFHHNGLCNQKCHKCNKERHFSRDCRSSGNANVLNAQRNNGANPKGNGCFKCGATWHFKRDCPKLKNKDGEKGNAPG